MNTKQIDRFIASLGNESFVNSGESYVLALSIGGDKRAVKAVIDYIDIHKPSSNIDMRKRYLDLLINLDRFAAAKVIGDLVIKEDNIDVRMHMVSLLEHTSDATAIPPLLHLAEHDDNIDVRIMAIMGIAHIGGTTAVATLERLVNDRNFSTAYETTVGEAAASVIKTIGEKGRD